MRAALTSHYTEFYIVWYGTRNSINYDFILGFDKYQKSKDKQNENKILNTKQVDVSLYK